jgi:glycosyltransferase involved in cell wall biosynthesis
MDKANLALAQCLIGRDTPVHIVCHGIDAQLASSPFATVHKVGRPANSYFLARPLLDFTGRRVARSVCRRWPNARVLINGGNCLWPGINWVHYVHHAWSLGPSDGPLWYRVKHGLDAWFGRKQERSAARISRLFITNSNRTSNDIIELGVDPRSVHKVYLGAESDWGLVTPDERAASRRALDIPVDRPVAVFIGSLGLDRRKGFDTLLEAWRRMCADPGWDVDLLLAGDGNAVGLCRQKIAEWNLQSRIRILGFSDRVRNLLAASDLLVSPVRYEAYGLNVQEAICRGVPAIVSASAGVAERYGPEYTALLLRDPEDVGELVFRLTEWRSNMAEWRSRFESFGNALRCYGWQEMAERLIEVVEQLDEPDGVPRG